MEHHNNPDEMRKLGLQLEIGAVNDFVIKLSDRIMRVE